MRCLLGIVFFCLVETSPVTSQEIPTGTDNVGLNRLTLDQESTPEVDQALKDFRSSENDAELANASERLLVLAKAANAEGNNLRAASLAKHVFLSSAPGKNRSQAYSILKQSIGNHHLAPHVREIVVRVPNVSCYGRFGDWLNATFKDQQGWILAIEVRNTDRVGDYAPKGELIIGTEAELKFVVDRSKNIDDLARLLNEHQHVKWILSVEQRLEEYAERWESTADEVVP